MLMKIGEPWQFESEAYLEDFVWANLESLLGLTPLKRQYFVKGEVCDILALDENRRLVVLELKNVEDRYVVQQLTRYYDSLLDERPFASQVDYEHPIRLVAITPKFHRHNEIDRKYHKLDFELLLFEVEQEGKKLYFSLNTMAGTQVSRLRIPYPEELILEQPEVTPVSKAIPRPPRALSRVLEDRLPDRKERILAIRQKILNFDERMGEISTAVTTRYGLTKGEHDIYKSKICAEFYAEFFLKKFYGLRFCLWLPYPKRQKTTFRTYYSSTAKAIIKIELVTQDWQSVQSLTIHRNPKPNASGYGIGDPKDYLKLYSKITGKEAKSASLDALVDIALEEWLERAVGEVVG